MHYKSRNNRNKYGLEHFEQNLIRLDKYLEEKSKKHKLVAIFDIGTKASRLLVGLADVPTTANEWNPNVFFNDGQVFNLGTDFNLYERALDINKSKALEGIIYFMNVYKQKLARAGLDGNDIAAVGTAVFRWMNNRDDVIAKIYNETGIKVIVLDKKDEAFLSSIAIAHTYTFGASKDFHNKEFKENEVILLFDQGGGSTEISYFYPGNRSMGNHDSINELGTVALQDNFFTLDVNQRIDPTTNRRRISTQFQRVNKLVEEKINNWKGFPEIMDEKKKIYVFGMGSALLKFFGRGSNYSDHNKRLTVDEMQTILDDYCKSLDQSNQQVRTLYNLVKHEERTGRKKLGTRLVLLYGLPVYEKLLKKFNLTELSYAAYGLRYGAYIAKHRFNWDLSSLPDEIKIDENNGRSKEGYPGGGMTTKKVFISYNHKDSDFVHHLKEELKKKNIHVAIDTETMKFGDDIQQFIKESTRGTEFTISVVSENSLKSPWVIMEALETLKVEDYEQKKKFIPIYIDKTVFDDNFVEKVVEKIDEDIKTLLKMTQALEDQKVITTHLDDKRQKLHLLRNSLSDIMHRLRKSLMANFSSNENININLPKLVEELINNS